MLLYQLNYKIMHMYKNITVRPNSVIQEVHFTLSYTLNTEAVSLPSLMSCTLIGPDFELNCVTVLSLLSEKLYLFIPAGDCRLSFHVLMQ